LATAARRELRVFIDGEGTGFGQAHVGGVDYAGRELHQHHGTAAEGGQL
jgi:hypothetical protein